MDVGGYNNVFLFHGYRFKREHESEVGMIWRSGVMRGRTVD